MRRRLGLPDIFYGWWIVGACFTIALYVAGSVFYGFTALFEPIADEFGWGHTEISFAASLRGLEIGLLAPLVGIMVDRLGPRRLILGGAIMSTIGLVILSQTTSLLMFYGAFLLLAVGVSATAQTVLMTAVANWFHRRVGLATGIAISGFGCGGLMVPLIVKLIDLYEWRTTVLILAAGMAIVVLPLSLVVRHRPEQYGLLPDGAAASTIPVSQNALPSHDNEAEMTARQALKSKAFWILALVFLVYSMLAIGIITHVMPYLSSIGVSRPSAALIATAIPLISNTGRFGFGWMGDRQDKRHVTAVCMGMMGVGMFCFGYAPLAGGGLLIAFLLLFSVGFGGANVQRAILVRELFGRKNFGSIFGLLIGINTLGSITGPTVTGWAFDHWGSYQGYQWMWFAFAAAAILAMIGVLITPHRAR